MTAKRKFGSSLSLCLVVAGLVLLSCGSSAHAESALFDMNIGDDDAAVDAPPKSEIQEYNDMMADEAKKELEARTGRVDCTEDRALDKYIDARLGLLAQDEAECKATLLRLNPKAPVVVPALEAAYVTDVGDSTASSAVLRATYAGGRFGFTRNTLRKDTEFSIETADDDGWFSWFRSVKQREIDASVTKEKGQELAIDAAERAYLQAHRVTIVEAHCLDGPGGPQAVEADPVQHKNAAAAASAPVAAGSSPAIRGTKQAN